MSAPGPVRSEPAASAARIVAAVLSALAPAGFLVTLAMAGGTAEGWWVLPALLGGTLLLRYPDSLAPAAVTGGALVLWVVAAPPAPWAAVGGGTCLLVGHAAAAFRADSPRDAVPGRRLVAVWALRLLAVVAGSAGLAGVGSLAARWQLPRSDLAVAVALVAVAGWLLVMTQPQRLREGPPQGR